MGNYVTIEVSGEVKLKESVSSDMIETLFEECLGDWWLKEHILHYTFYVEGKWGLTDEEGKTLYDRAFDRLVELGYNSEGWEEEVYVEDEYADSCFGDEDCPPRLRPPCLRGTLEQQKLLLEKIAAQNAEL